MEIPVINRINNINAIPNPSIISFSKISQANEILKYGALLLAILASFTTILNKIKLVILKLQSRFQKTQPLLDFSDDWSDISDDETCSCSSISDHEVNDDDPKSNFDDKDEDFFSLGSGCSGVFRWKTTESTLASRPSFGDLWSGFTGGKNVVNLWDNFGLFDYDSCDETENKEDEKFSSSFTTDCQFPSGLVLSAAVDDARKAALRVWDSRIGGRIPAILAEWRPEIGRIVGVSGISGDQVFFRGGGVRGEVAVGDMRKLSSPLVNLSRRRVATQWDTVGESGESSLVAR